MAADDWARALTAGDEVGVTDHRRRLVRMEKVARVTPTGQIVVKDQRFKIGTFGGVREIGDSRYGDELLSKDQAIALKQTLERQQARRDLLEALRQTEWNKLSDEQLTQVKELIDRFSS
jgi:hypothetical protein